MVSSLQDFILQFPPATVKTERKEYHSPCPFCLPDGTSDEIVFNQVRFYGRDRLVWFGAGLYCRSCARHSRGRNNNGFYTYDDLADKLNVTLTDSFDLEFQTQLDDNPLHMLWTEDLVQRSQKEVDYAYWRKFGWTDATIQRFRLGKGTLYSQDGPVNTIPMQVEHVSDADENASIRGLYYVSGRQTGLPPKRTPGSSRQYFWRIINDPAATVAVVAEGEKDGITLAQLFPNWNIFVSFGSTAWSKEKTALLQREGYQTVWVMGDCDAAGEKFSENVTQWAKHCGIPTAGYLHWRDSEYPSGYDVTDLLQNSTEDFARIFIQQRLQVVTYDPAGVTRGLFIDCVPEPPAPAASDFFSLDEIRGSGEHSLAQQVRDFLKTYSTDRTQPQLLLLAAPPGAGKTHTLIQLAEEIAQQQYDLRLAERAKLQENIAGIQAEIAALPAAQWEERKALLELVSKLQRRLDDFSYASIAWYGQYKDGYDSLLATGANPALWFNFEARHEGNCANFSTISAISNNYHDTGRYCQLVCPFRRECEQSGYLSQDRQRHQYPLTFFRFQHLTGDRGDDYRQLIVIDENPGGIIDNNPLRVKASDVYPFTDGWDLDVEDRQLVLLIDLLTAAVRGALGTASAETLSGNRFFKLVDTLITGFNPDWSLAKILAAIDYDLLERVYQPYFMGGDIATIRKRVVPPLLQALLHELPDYLADPEFNRPSAIHLIDGVLEIYEQNPVLFPRQVPMIVADATSLPILYQGMFQREVKVYQPKVRNPAAEVMVVHGSDWTKSQIYTELGKDLALLKAQEPLNENVYHRRVVRDALAIIRGLLEKHEKLLVVTHKNIRELFEELFKDDPAFPRVAWGHYGALRGTNTYAEYPAVCLIGAFRVPYDVVYRRISAWAYLLKIKDDISAETVIKPAVYDTQSSGHGYRTFNHWFGDLFVNMIETGEMIQSAERIRPHATGSKKYVYVLASRPALPYVTRVIHKKEFMKAFIHNKESDIEKYLREWYIQYGDFPAYREVVARFGGSNSVVKRLREKVAKELAGGIME
jgi:DNA polymerase III delta prime subunit